MPSKTWSPFLEMLKDRVDLRSIPFTERGSRLMLFHSEDGFSIRLAERWLEPEQTTADADSNPPALIDRWQLTDEDGNPLTSQLTVYPHCVYCETIIGTFKFIFVDFESILIEIPAAKCGMTFNTRVRQAHVDRRGGVLRLSSPTQRNIAYTTNAVLFQNEIVSQESHRQAIHLKMDARQGGKSLRLNITPSLGLARWIPDPDQALHEAEQRWHDWFAAAPEVSEDYRRQYYYAWWVMRAGLISPRSHTTREAMMPSKTKYVGLWQWDNFFHALAFRHVDPRLAQNQLRVVLDHQRPDGMIPDAIHDDRIVTYLDHPISGDVTKPPLIAWAAWKLYEFDQDREFLDEIYEALVRWTHWWFDKNDSDQNGLCEYRHPYSSGLDDSPLWDDGMPVESPDLNSYLCLQQEALAKIAGVIGEQKDAVKWSERADAIAQRLIRDQWDAETGLFWATRNGNRVNVRTPFNLFPLITGRMPSPIAERLVAHLTNEKEFWSRYPVPTVALDDPKFSPTQMWRGPTWININYLLIGGLRRSGYGTVADELRQKTLALVASHNDIYEYYDPQTGSPPPDAASSFGWSAALYIDLAIQASTQV